MRIIIAGNGKMGAALVRQLSAEGEDLTLIDSNLKVLESSEERYDIMVVQGNCASMQILLQAGVKEADLLIAMTGADEINLLCCMTAHAMNARLHTIARVRNPDYADQLVLMKEELGLSMTVNPEMAAATEIARMLRFPSALKLDSFARGMVERVEIKVKEGSPLLGQALYTLSSHLGIRILICAVRRGEEVYIPTGSFVLQQGDKISITATPSEMDSLFRKLGIYRHKIHRVMVVGGGRIAYYLAKQLLKLGMSVKIIEKDAARCELLSEALPKARIILGDGSDRELLEEEGIEEMDALVALTGMDEENIIISMYAGTLELGKVVTKINRMSFQEILDSASVDGCDDFKFLIKICIPLATPILAVNVLLYAVGHWNSYFNEMMYLNTTTKFPLQLVMREILMNMNTAGMSMDVTKQLEIQETKYLLQYTTIIVGSVPVMLLYPLVQKYFVKGIMVGAIKG